ncbi:MAG: hypothetical protein ABF719_03160 [Acetobacter sp.]|uniref:hypothetical protein n=1 Tax=Acetobacter sp. TaxID=440 RepID=UPI0039E99E73
MGREKFKTKSSFSEAQVEADVAMYLGWCTALNTQPFRLLDVNEQKTGADKKFDAIVAIYIQFKKSDALAEWHRPKKLPEMSPLQSIRKFRSEKELADSPTLYFKLRDKAEKAIDFQHNVLYYNNKPPISYSIYVAPLTLNRDEYYNDLCCGPRFLSDPWVWRRQNIHDGRHPSGWTSRFDIQPFLRKHISIIPHETVRDSNHFYAFSEMGDDVSWHSPGIINGGPFRLSDFMSRRIHEIFSEEQPLTTVDEALSVATSVLNQLNIDSVNILNGENSFDRLKNYGRWLHKNFSIRQMILCLDKEEIQKIRFNLRR